VVVKAAEKRESPLGVSQLFQCPVSNGSLYYRGHRNPTTAFPFFPWNSTAIHDNSDNVQCPTIVEAHYESKGSEHNYCVKYSYLLEDKKIVRNCVNLELF
jgi:hypothetical protein